MKAFSRFAPLIFLSLAPFSVHGAGSPTVAGPWTELRAAPVFAAPTQKLSRNWGPALPIGQEFQVEKVYGRWLYGTPEPIARMTKKEFAKPGWVFSRMLLVPGDEDSLPLKVKQKSRAVLFHARTAWQKLGLGKPPLVSKLDFFESLVLSKGTLTAFKKLDEAPMVLSPWKSFLSWAWPEAVASEKEAPPTMGLAGTNLEFLDQEFKVIQKKKAAAEKKRQAALLRPPPEPKLTQEVREAILGRYMLEKYLELPTLTHEEVDGFIYMKAAAMRSLQGCPKEVQDYWKDRRWNHLRVYRMKSRPEVPHPWLEVALPGGYFALSARAIELAGNESEFAFLLVRPMVKEMRIHRKKTTFQPKSWPAELENLSEEIWSHTLKAQSTKESENLDVADEIAIDMTAIECISRAGYRPMAGLSYLRKISAKREESWAKWFTDQAIGLDYRLERVSALVGDALAKQAFPEGKVSNPKRFATASRHWNLLP